MNIAIIGYGKMGKEIEKVAIQRNHQVKLIVDKANESSFVADNLKNIDVAIEFSTPDSAFYNIIKCFEADIPVICGTTGWLDKFDELKNIVNQQNKTFLYSSNFSIGVNIFFKINEFLAKIMNNFKDYNVEIEEVHHTQKLDKPSGTAITLANQMLKNIDRKSGWTLENASDKDIFINSVRESDVVGIHKIRYENEFDFIELQHNAKTRTALALGTIMAAEFIIGKKGMFSMNDVISIS